ncbi:Mrp/NBP35 family ATP-binding protein [Pseudophaeobacter arcticus]|jgi:ATP-binding protein involved in chromosome partitioning|uniref:Mrp/NBP35 family ATP-binding protein n=1 Tax=Pseudophaeobacter arcticus TaxID=385492 RepID=UPI0039E3D248
MSVTHKRVEEALERLALPDGGTLISRDMIRALTLQAGEGVNGLAKVSFVIEAPSPAIAQHMEPLRRAAEAAVLALDGVGSVSVALTAHGPAARQAAKPAATPGATLSAPSLKIGGHPKPQATPIKPKGVSRILAVASGKGGVGKSTVSANLAVALARQGRRVGLLDADIYGPSQPRMMGVSGRPASPDGTVIEPLRAHGVTIMSIGFMVPEDKAVVWRGPMLMGALQQMLGQVNWGELDVLIVDLPPGTGDVQLTLCTKSELSGAIVVSTPQDVALIDARKALDMFKTLKTPVLGLIENMSFFTCPDCGGVHHIFGHGGVASEAKSLGLPLLGALPIDLETRLAGDAGTPVALGEGPVSEAYAQIARGLVAGGMA